MSYDWWHLRCDEIGNIITDHLSCSEVDVNLLAEPVGTSVQLPRLYLWSPDFQW